MKERENTEEVEVSVWETDWSDEVGDAMTKLIDKFDAYHTNGSFKITIVFIPEGEEDE